MKRKIGGALVAALLTFGLEGVSPVTAASDPGDHVSGMAPEHAVEHGQVFGDCLSEMASGGECQH